MTNLERMIQLAEEFFGTRNDPEQISVNEEVMERLRAIHPNTLSEQQNKDGPIAWILLLPTTQGLMRQFIGKNITEKELLDKTPLGETYDALYLCSALVLPEERGKGLAKRLASQAIKAIQKEHPLKFLFVWEFSAEGEHLAEALAEESHLPLYRRVD